MIKLLLLALAISSFFGCSSKEHSALPKHPTWYLKSYPQTKESIYAVGVGRSKDDSIKSALDNISKSLHVEISSTSIQKSSYEKNGAIDEQISKTDSQISAKTRPIVFHNFKLLKSYVNDEGEFYSLVEADKNSISSAVEDELGSTMEEVKERVSKKQNIFRQRSALFAAINALEEKKYLLQILKQLKAAYDPQPYENTLRAYKKELNHLQTTSTCRVLTDSGSLRYKGVLEEYLIKNHFKITEFNPSLTLKIKSSNNQNFEMGFYVIKQELTLDFFEKNSLILTKNIALKAFSTSSYEDASSRLPQELLESLPDDLE